MYLSGAERDEREDMKCGDALLGGGGGRAYA